jgi:hypothetical protein
MIGMLQPVTSFTEAAHERLGENWAKAGRDMVAQGQDADAVGETTSELLRQTDLLSLGHEDDDWITLSEAILWTGGKKSSDTEVVRVRLSSVDAWWVPIMSPGAGAQS